MSRTEIKHPHIKIRLVGEDGNAFSILGRTQKALRRGGVSDSDIDSFIKEAKSGDYDHLLAVVMATVTCDEDEDEDEDEDTN